jgi:hypothetical protein
MQIKGLIFDSGWSSIADVSHTAFVSEVDGIVRKRLKESNWLYRPMSAMAKGMVHVAHFCIARPILSWRKKKMMLVDKIDQIDIPMFYIHAQGDQYASIEPVQRLADHTKRATSWWISEQSKHACHHLKLKEQYRERLLNFIDDCLPAVSVRRSFNVGGSLPSRTCAPKPWRRSKTRINEGWEGVLGQTFPPVRPDSSMHSEVNAALSPHYRSS